MTRGQEFVSAIQRIRLAHRAGVLAVVLCALATGHPPVLAQNPLPTAEQILDRFIEVTGGKEAYLKIENRVRQGTMEIPRGMNNKLVMDVTMYEAEPAETYYIRSTSADSRFETGTHDGMAWSIGPGGRARVIEGDALKRALHEAAFHSPVKWRDVYQQAKCEEEIEFEGELCYKVKMVWDLGEEEWYFSKETGLWRGRDWHMETRRGNIRLRMIFKDYREIDGISLPYRIERVRRSQPLGAVVYSSIEHNVELPPDRFEPPQAVQELLQEQEPSASDGEQMKETPKSKETVPPASDPSSDDGS